MAKKNTKRSDRIFDIKKVHKNPLNPTKRTRKGTRGAIQTLYSIGYNKSKIASILKINAGTVNLWVRRGTKTTYSHPRKLKATPEQMEWIKSMAANKETIKDSASGSELSKAFLAKFGVRIATNTMNKYLLRLLARPRKIRKVFYLTEDHRNNRISFIKQMTDKGIKGKDIFFSDEKKFMFRRYPNSSTNYIRLTKENDLKLKKGDTEILKLVSCSVAKFEQGFMVSGGISYYGLSKLVFCVGTVNGFSYKQCLFHYARDFRRLGMDLYLQQDGASPHKAKQCKEFIASGFRRSIEDWPASSPDLSPIELVWAIMEHELSKKKYNNITEKKKELIRLWNSFPIELCRKLIDTFDYRCKWVSENNGAPYNQRNEIKDKSKVVIPNIWTPWNPSLDIENIQYNDESLKVLKDSKISLLNKKRSSLYKEYKSKGQGKNYTFNELKLREKNWGNGARLRQYIKDGEEFEVKFQNEFLNDIDEELNQLNDPKYLHEFMAKLTKDQRHAATLSTPFYLKDDHFGEQSTNAESGIVAEEDDGGVEMHNRLNNLNIPNKISTQNKKAHLGMFYKALKKFKKTHEEMEEVDEEEY